MNVTSFLKKVARHTALPLAYWLGANKVMRRLHQNPYLIVCYHGVGRQSSLPYNGRHIEAEVFERHLAYFQKHFDVVPLDEAFQGYQQDQRPTRPTLAITFDDGYLNNYEVAFPLLKKYDMPATIFVAAVCTQNPDYVIWKDVLDVLRIARPQERLEICGQAYYPAEDFDFRSAQDGSSLAEMLVKLPPPERDKAIGEVKETYEFDRWAEELGVDFFRLMNVDQLKELADSGLVSIQAHSVWHHRMANIPLPNARQEMSLSMRMLEEATGQPVNAFAFPAGNYNQAVKQLGKDLGYDYLLAETYRLDTDPADPAILPRISISGTTNYYSQILYLHWQMARLGF